MTVETSLPPAPAVLRQESADFDIGLVSPENMQRYSAVQFNSPLLHDFSGRFLQFLDSDLGRLVAADIDKITTTVYEHYAPDKAARITKAMVLGVTAHQNNDNQKKLIRKKEKLLGGETPPTAIHLMRIVQKGLDHQMRSEYIASRWLHDLSEDVTMKFSTGGDQSQEKVLQGADWLEIIRGEFTEGSADDTGWSDGDVMADIVEGLTSPPSEDLPPEQRLAIQSSPIYMDVIESILRSPLIDKEDRQKAMATAVETYGEDILKAVSSYAHAFTIPMKYKNDPERYALVRLGIDTTKVDDIDDNLRDAENVSIPKQYRARMASVIARLMDSPVSTDILVKLSKVMNISDPNEPHLLNPANQQIIDHLKDSQIQSDTTDIADFASSWLETDGKKIEVRAELPVNISDENLSTGDKTGFGIQYSIKVPSDQIDTAIRDGDYFVNWGVDIADGGLKRVAGIDGPLILQETVGIVHQMQIAFGRETRIYSVQEKETGNTKCVIKLLDDKPTLMDLAREGSTVKPEDVPEWSFFASNVFDNSSEEATYANMLNGSAVFYNPDALAPAKCAVVAWSPNDERQGGYITCNANLTLDEACGTIGIDCDEYEIDLYEGNKGNDVVSFSSASKLSASVPEDKKNHWAPVVFLRPKPRALAA